MVRCASCGKLVPESAVICPLCHEAISGVDRREADSPPNTPTKPAPAAFRPRVTERPATFAAETKRETAKTTADNAQGFFISALGPVAVVLLAGGVFGVVVAGHDAFFFASLIGVVCFIIRVVLD
jgi:hypothetical protein